MSHPPALFQRHVACRSEQREHHVQVFSHFAECSLAPSEPLVHASQEGQNGAFGTSDTRNVEEILEKSDCL